jgi:hypothetical protein
MLGTWRPQLRPRRSPRMPTAPVPPVTSAHLRRRLRAVAPCSFASRRFAPLRGRLRRPGHELRAVPHVKRGRRRRGAPLGARARGR